MTLYGRRISVEVAGLTISEPRISLSIARQADQTQTTGHVNIYNLAPERSQQIYERGRGVVIRAGYPTTIAQIFAGNSQRVLRPRQDLAHITHIRLGDTVHAAGRLGGVTARSWAGPVRVREIVADLVADLFRNPTDLETLDIAAGFIQSLFEGDLSSFGGVTGFRLGPLDAIPAGATVTDWSWSGSSAAGLTVILKRVGCAWFEDDGLIRFRRVGMGQADAPRIVASPATGLVGAPAETDDGVEATVFLNPLVRKGGTLDLRSETLTGVYTIVGLRHDADNWEGAFTTWMDLRPQ